MPITYQGSGVNINDANKIVKNIKEKAKTTFSPYVLSGIGSFGALFDIKEALKDYQHPVLTQSVDGVGTKLMIAKMMNRYNTIGYDIVAHCCNDIITTGAKPLTFLDYVASSKLDTNIVENIIGSIAEACKKNNISLIGGETAEMPGIYISGESDIVGHITGAVEKDKIITGEKIKPGDRVLGFASNGLHTNGYSLARKIFFEIEKHNINTKIPELEKTIGETLLASHTNYTKPILDLLNSKIEINGIAHITGGGMLENIPRILPENCAVEIKKDSWPILPVFKIIQRIGDIEEKEMYRTFNMGIGMVIIVSPEDVEPTKDKIKEHSEFKLYNIGKVIDINERVKFI